MFQNHAPENAELLLFVMHVKVYLYIYIVYAFFSTGRPSIPVIFVCLPNQPRFLGGGLAGRKNSLSVEKSYAAHGYGSSVSSVPAAADVVIPSMLGVAATCPTMLGDFKIFKAPEKEIQLLTNVEKEKFKVECT